ncbi:hypothetical protein LWI29_031802 [Acer saccharum]|uniref:Myb-like domain-containing protein n=1 Tax=Acer saccharum TaxID=4024 RepID=A0AA39SDK8_ACESA|nr:hypothetical protein LWI29_031802 [Acer saccharum]
MDRVKLSQLRLRSPFFKKKKSSNNNGQASSAEFAAENSAELGSGAGSDETARTLRPPRIRWTPELHKIFVDVVDHLGINNATPKTIMQLMNVDGLTKGHVSRHLQIYRTVKGMQGLSGAGAGADADADADDDDDDVDNNGGGGDKNKKKGGGSGDGEGSGDKAEGGDGKEKGMNMDCTGQLGFGYRCTYHAGYENGYPVEQLNALKMFCSENMINDFSIMPSLILV